MSLTVTQRPQITYEGEDSTWNALRNPVLYKFQREDYQFTQINNNGGFVQLQFNSVNLTTSFATGDSVRVLSDNSVYDDIGLVTAEAFSGGNTLITLDIAYVSAAPGGFANLITFRPNYRIEVEVYDSANTLLNESPFYYSPNANGEAVVNVSKILLAYVLPDFTIDLTGTTEVFEDTAYKKFYIKYRERWTGSAESQTNDSANQFFVVLAAMQIPAPNGGNMAIYAIPETKFLTKMDSPVMWRGYPFLIGAIVNENISSNVYLSAAPDATTPANLSGKQVLFDINQIINDDSVDEVTVALYQDTSSAVDISEEKTIELRDPCEEPIMLLGRNSLGGPLQWLFEVNQDLTYDNADGIKVRRLRLYADDLTINEWESLQDFITLGEVYKNYIPELLSTTIKTHTRIGNQVYVLNADGTKIGVIVVPRVKGTETRQVKHSFDIDIEYPEIFA